MAQHSDSKRYRQQVAIAAVAAATLRNKMDEEQLQAFRRERLAAALETLTKGNKAELGRQLGYASGAYIRQMIAGERPITEKTVRQIEHIRGMRGWFSQKSAGPSARPQPSPGSGEAAGEASAEGWPFDSVTAAQYTTLAGDQRVMVETFVNMILRLNAGAKSEAAARVTS